MATTDSLSGSSGDVDKAIAQPVVSEKEVEAKGKRGFQFWMCFASLILPTFLVALDIVCFNSRLYRSSVLNE